VNPDWGRLRPDTWALTVCLLGFALLTWQLGDKNLWVDETLNMHTTAVVRGDLGGLVDNITARAHPPLYFLCLWIWRTFAGESELGLRFSSVFFGMLSIAMLYPLGTRMISQRVGLMAMSLMAISPFLVLSSRIAQYYSLMLFVSLVSYWFFLQLLDGGSGVAKWAGYLVSSAVAMYTHYLIAFVLAAQAVIALSQIRHRRRFALQVVGTQMIAVVLLTPWVSALMGQAVRQHALPDPFPTSSPAMSVLTTVHPIFAWIVGETIYPWNPAAVVGLIVGIWLATKGLVSLRGATRGTLQERLPQDTAQTNPVAKQRVRHVGYLDSVRTPKTMSFAVFILLPLVLTSLTIGQFTAGGDPFPARRAIFCAPFVYLLMAEGVRTISPPGRLLAVAVLAIPLGVSLNNYYLGREFHNPAFALPTRAIAEVIDEHSRPGDVFVSDVVTAFGYYMQRKNPDAVHFYAPDAASAMNYIAREQSPRVWLILLCRAVETESLATIELVPWLLTDGYLLESAEGYAPLDDAYARLQELILRKPACEHKIRVYRYARFQ
jgi:4-amino-4-deoxy-L-arabinose transferase-like glycosyltransferase